MSKPHGNFTDSRSIQLDGREIVVVGSRGAFEAELVVGVTLHNHALALCECLSSLAAQRDVPLPFTVLILDDDSKDDWRTGLQSFSLRFTLAVAQATCRSATSARNCLLDVVDGLFPKARWVARLDADDRFASSDSLAAAVRLAMSSNARFVLGGNRLRLRGQLLDRTNPALPDLLRSDYVLSRLSGMARGEPEAELPSCNLLLATHAGWRYRAQPSAEDHWLVAELLLRHPREGAILTEPFYADYSLEGALTVLNHKEARYLSARRALLRAAEAWAGKGSIASLMLGSGMEGVVSLEDGHVCKRFHFGALDDQRVEWLQQSLRNVMPHLPEPVWQKEGEAWSFRYRWFETESVEALGLTELREFFVFCLRQNLVCTNISRANFRRHPQGGLVLIDIGRDVRPMNVDFFRDACARGFVLAELGWTDDELRRRSKELRDEATLRSLPGFAEFYSSILQEHACQQWTAGVISDWPKATQVEPRITLLIIACAMDASFLAAQVRHIVGQMEHPTRFARRLLVLDPFQGPFLRQHCDGDWERLVGEAEALRVAGWLDCVLVGPSDTASITAINERWFGQPARHSHCIRNIRTAPQLFAFEQIATRYVMVCDVDVLIGRRDYWHDYLAEMLAAIQSPDVMGVSMNIPHDLDGGFHHYGAPAGEFAPEVRCGLLDLQRVLGRRPLPNSLKEGRLVLAWHRSLQQLQRKTGLRTLRGGSPESFFVHPPNEWKRDEQQLDVIRDLVAQGKVPSVQFDQWDLVGQPSDWRYEPRHESIVFVVKGRNTAPAKVKRCLRSLAMQDDQDFGIVLVDDASDNGNASVLPHLLRPFAGRCTLVCRTRRHGYMPNTLLAVRDIISSPDALAVVLDLDDALLHRSVVRRLKQTVAEGADMVLAAMFRPDKPLKLYHPDFVATREKWGGEAWIHLRSFRKRLLDALPVEDLQLDGQWIEDCEDYATMIPLVEMAVKPVYLPEYLYFHERSTLATPELRTVKDGIIRRILAKAARRATTNELEIGANP